MALQIINLFNFNYFSKQRLISILHPLKGINTSSLLKRVTRNLSPIKSIGTYMTHNLTTQKKIQMTADNWTPEPTDKPSMQTNNSFHNSSLKGTSQQIISPYARGLQMMLISPADELRKETEQFINAGYKKHFEAELVEFFPIILVVKDWKKGRILGAVGLRYADDYKLFSEQYLNQSIESAIASHQIADINRDEIIELGHFVVDQNHDVNTVIPMVASFLKSLNVKWAVYTLSRPIKVAFQKLGIQLTHLQHAHPKALQGSASDWGKYYDFKPAVYYSNILTNMNS